ncbi:F-box/LRR-repeat protein 20 isoform X7 [Thamnophis elegans]|uniref:F-box/LRR-repeat protein 20 isoform X7 n=1 Tax=Thamnophis elegans TaxID=35005 RepID=UPI00137748E9|nr:F-box/LRR-repeat protein 20 isoform X7 [Thamnophis elegans]
MSGTVAGRCGVFLFWVEELVVVEEGQDSLFSPSRSGACRERAPAGQQPHAHRELVPCRLALGGGGVVVVVERNTAPPLSPSPSRGEEGGRRPSKRPKPPRQRGGGPGLARPGPAWLGLARADPRRASAMRREMNGVTKGRFEMFSNNDEAVINKKLPKELLLRIFSFLDVVTLCRCAQVSRAWNVLALDGSNWQRIDLFDFQRDIEGRVVENISKRCGGFLRKLSLRGCLGVGDNALRIFAQNCRNIEVLNLNGCTKITDATCTSLSKFCSKLRHLDLASCTSITNLSLKALSEGCPLLEQLNISWCDQVTKDGIQNLVRGCGGLKALFLKGCTQLEDEALKYIGANCPELVTLNLQTCLQITDDGLITICRGCHKLQSLCASGCSNITDAILNALGQNCPKLREDNGTGGCLKASEGSG